MQFKNITWKTYLHIHTYTNTHAHTQNTLSNNLNLYVISVGRRRGGKPKLFSDNVNERIWHSEIHTVWYTYTTTYNNTEPRKYIGFPLIFFFLFFFLIFIFLIFIFKQINYFCFVMKKKQKKFFFNDKKTKNCLHW